MGTNQRPVGILSRRISRFVGGLLVILAMQASMAYSPESAGAKTSCGDVRLFWMMGSGQEPGADEARKFFNAIGHDNLGRRLNVKYSQPDWDPVEVDPDHDYPKRYFRSMSRGGELLAEYLNHYADRCPDEQLIIGGYSQGAHSVRSALRNKVDRGIRDRIVAVGLFGDPTQGVVQYSRDGRFKTTYKFLGIKRTRDGLPRDLKGRLFNYCHGRDLVCYVGIGSNTDDHERYADRSGEIVQFASLFQRSR